MCAEFAKDSTEFFDKWTKINREWRSVFFANGHPTEEAAFAAKYGHPRLRDFVRATSDDAPPDGFNPSAYIDDGEDGTLRRSSSLISQRNTMAHVAAKHAKRDDDHHFELILVLVKSGADVTTLRNEDGLTVVDIGKASTNKNLQHWAKAHGLFLGRYNFIGSPVHHSATCLVIFAHDLERNQFVDEELAVTTGELALADGLADVDQLLIDDALADEDGM